MRAILLISLLCFGVAIQAQQQFRVTVPSLALPKGAGLVLKANDTAYRPNKQGGESFFVGAISDSMPQLAVLVLVKNDEAVGVAPVWIYPGTTQITRLKLDDLSSMEATGKHPIFLHEKQLQQRLRATQQKVTALENKANSGKIKEADWQKFEREYLELENRLQQLTRNYVRDYPNRYRSALLLDEAKVDWGRDSCEALFLKFPTELQQHPVLASVRTYIEVGGHVGKGDQVPRLVGLNPKGDSLSLDQFRGKWVLIDFWASWCPPCRQENPALVQLYDRFKPRGLEIFAVSLDVKRADWIKAIEQDGLTWQHISDLKGFGSMFAYRFGVNAVPTKFLVNPSGLVVARDITIESLQVQLGELLPNSSN